MSSPTFVAKFADGVVTRMSCYCERGQLDLKRGIKLSQAAYEVRTKKEPPPEIIEGRFVMRFINDVIKEGTNELIKEYTDELLKEYTVAELNPSKGLRDAAE
jgi:hypothetical protein